MDGNRQGNRPRKNFFQGTRSSLRGTSRWSYFSTEAHRQIPPNIRQIFPQIMTIRLILRYPDPRLAVPARPVTEFGEALRELARDLLETMHAAPGIGITAPHIGVFLRVVVLDLGGS